MKEGEPGYHVSTRKGRVPSAEEKASLGPASLLWFLEHHEMGIILPPSQKGWAEEAMPPVSVSKLANGSLGPDPFLVGRKSMSLT